MMRYVVWMVNSGQKPGHQFTGPAHLLSDIPPQVYEAASPAQAARMCVLEHDTKGVVETCPEVSKWWTVIVVDYEGEKRWKIRVDMELVTKDLAPGGSE